MWRHRYWRRLRRQLIGKGPEEKHRGLSEVPEPVSKTIAATKHREADAGRGRSLVLAASQPSLSGALRTKRERGKELEWYRLLKPQKPPPITHHTNKTTPPNPAQTILPSGDQYSNS